MHNRQLLLIVAISLALSQNTLYAQQVVNTSGATTTRLEGSVSYSVGQLVCQNFVGTTGSLAEGVQQPFEISAINGIEEYKNLSLTVKAYPNPVKDYLVLKTDGMNIKQLNCQLFTVTGKMLLHQKLVSNETELAVSSLKSGTYILKVLDRKKEIKTFRIIKN